MMMDVERARFNMVEQQIRPWELLDTRVLDLLHKVKREDFVPAAYQALAFADLEISIGQGEKMLSPKLEARILQELAINPLDRILENGDAARGWDWHGPYDVIVLTGSVPLLTESFQQSLNSGGRMFAVVGVEPAMEARLITCAAPGAYSSASLFETCVPALRNAPQRAQFSF